MADKTLITLTSPDGATLNTAGTYCEGDIEVVPKLQSKTAATGEIVTADNGYVGLESVDTNPAFEAGKKSEYDAFWDNLQRNGTRTDYAIAFVMWNDTMFRPKYSMKPSFGAMMFYASEMVNIKESLESCGVTLDTSECSHFTQMFQSSKTVEVPFIDASSATNTSSAFNGARFESLVIKFSETTPYNSTFSYLEKLKELTIEGTIGQNGFSVINSLSSTTTGLTVTLRLAAVNTAFETSAGAADGSTSDEWLALAATKSNWTINLINS